MRRVYGNIAAAGKPGGSDRAPAKSRNKIARARRSSYRRCRDFGESPSGITTRQRMRGPKLDRIDRQILDLLQSTEE